jgi:toxin FitB
MKYLADANLISEPTKTQASPLACAWLTQHQDEVVVDAIVLGEIWDGIAGLPTGRKKHSLLE